MSKMSVSFMVNSVNALNAYVSNPSDNINMTVKSSLPVDFNMTQGSHVVNFYFNIINPITNETYYHVIVPRNYTGNSSNNTGALIIPTKDVYVYNSVSSAIRYHATHMILGFFQKSEVTKSVYMHSLYSEFSLLRNKYVQKNAVSVNKIMKDTINKQAIKLNHYKKIISHYRSLN